MSEAYIYHICTSTFWETQSLSDVYIHDSLDNEGFIHCSHENQLKGVLDRYFQNQQNLIILTLDPSRLIPELKYELAPIGELFPHIFGPINKDAIISTKKIRTTV
ncbi:MAG: DUF952 domain-containing protein [Bacteroidota bacterium]